VLVGLIAVAAQTRPRLALVAPFVASVTVSTLVLFAYEQDWIDAGTRSAPACSSSPTAASPPAPRA
jgi:hypothetical protein